MNSQPDSSPHFFSSNVSDEPLPPNPFGISRRGALKTALAAGAGVFAAAGPAMAQSSRLKDVSPKRFEMKKSINLWAFPYPQKMNLQTCLQLAKDAGFDGIELNYDLDNDLSPKSGTKEFGEIRKM